LQGRFTTRAQTCDLTALIDLVEKLLDHITEVDQLVSMRVGGMLAQTRPYWQGDIVGGFSLRQTTG